MMRRIAYIAPLFLLAVLFLLPQPARADISWYDVCTGTTSCSAVPSHLTGDIFIAWACRNASATAPTLPTGWTNVGTRTINGSGSADSACRVACKITTSTSDTITGFTNSGFLNVWLGRGQSPGDTAACTSGGAILGTIQFLSSAANTTTDTITYPAVTSSSAASWILTMGFSSAATDVETAPATQTNRTSVGSGPEGAIHDSNGPDDAFSQTDVTLNASGRVIAATLEIKPAPCSNTVFLTGWTCVQAKGTKNGGSGNTLNAVFSTGVTGTNMVAALAFACGDSGCSSSMASNQITISNTAGDAETKGPNSCTPVRTNFYQLCGAAMFTVTAGVTQFTATCDSTCWYLTLQISEWATPTGTRSFDTSGFAGGTATSSSVPLDASTAEAQELIFGFSENSADAAMTAGSGWVEINEEVTGNHAIARVTSTAGSYTCESSWSGSNNWGGSCFAVKVVSAAAGIDKRDKLHRFGL